jgi:hypothetical protein
MPILEKPLLDAVGKARAQGGPARRRGGDEGAAPRQPEGVSPKGMASRSADSNYPSKSNELSISRLTATPR